jgi:hypothetical protein
LKTIKTRYYYKWHGNVWTVDHILLNQKKEIYYPVPDVKIKE